MNPSPACTHRITADYQAAYPDPIRVRAGEPVTVSDRREQSEGHTWVWCTDARGKSGWVPQTYLEPTPAAGSSPATTMPPSYRSKPAKPSP
jgi:uncharacterized protein YgiM (DUF1202 family)